jgi:hypothetical protein
MQTSLSRRAHAPIIILVVTALIAALWAALGRIGWRMPQLPIPILGQHGALMISGFLGTLVSLERAVALQRRWAYLVPFLSALGAFALLIGLPFEIGRGLIALAALGLTIIFWFIYRLRPTIDIATMAAGAGMADWQCPVVVRWTDLSFVVLVGRFSHSDDCG